MKRKTVGIFGGSFNPVHAGHLAVAGAAVERRLVDEVWFMPCRRNPLKDKDPEFSDKERFNLIEKALQEGLPEAVHISPETLRKFKITDVDMRLPSPSFTCDSLRRLAEENPDCNFRFIMGSDSYMDFNKWKNPDYIRRNFGLIVYPRPGYPLEAVEENCVLLDDVTLFDISSTQIRNNTNLHLSTS